MHANILLFKHYWSFILASAPLSKCFYFKLTLPMWLKSVNEIKTKYPYSYILKKKKSLCLVTFKRLYLLKVKTLRDLFVFSLIPSDHFFLPNPKNCNVCSHLFLICLLDTYIDVNNYIIIFIIYTVYLLY